MTSFQDYAGDYMDDLGYRWATSTKNNYASRVRILATHVGQKELDDLKPRDLDRIASTLYAEAGHRRAECLMRLLVAILNDAHANNKCSKAFTWKSVKQQEQKPIDPLSPNEVRRVISRIDEHYQPLFWFLYCTGCRPCEALALKWGDLENSHVNISKGRVRGKEGGTKTRRFRKVPLNKKLRAVITSLSRRGDDQFVFVGKRGEPLNGHLDRIWRKAIAEVGIRHRASYNLRHSFASAALYNGVAMPVISRILGHSSLETTFRYYASSIKDMPDGEEKLDAMFDESEGQTA